MSIINCPECGKEISDKAANCPNCGCPIGNKNGSTDTSAKKPVPPKKKGSCLKTVLIAFGVIIVLMIFIGMISGQGNETEVQKTGELETESQNQDESETITQEPKEEADEQEQTDQEETEAKDIYFVGDIVETDNLKITFISSEPYVSDNEYIQPKDGYEYWRFEFAFENISNSDQTISSMTDWECYADNAMTDQTWIGDESGLDGTLSPGRTSQGSVYFEVPSGSENIEVEYAINFLTEDKIIFAGK